MKVEVVLTEADIAQEFAEALQARDLPGKFFFWSPRSAQAWRALTADAALYGGLAATWRTLAGNSGQLACNFGGRIPVISFGAGDGARDLMLMTAFKDEDTRDCSYFPVDASQAMLEIACAAADDDDFDTTGIKADISSPVHLVYAADAAEPPRLFVLSGNTLGAFDPLAQIRYISQCMRPPDLLIVDGEMYEVAKTLARRDLPVVHGFLHTLLTQVGIGREDGVIRFEHRIDERHEGLHQITRTFRADRDISTKAVGEEISIERGERLGLNFNYTYTPDSFRWLLKEQGGLQIVQEHISPDGRFLTAICRK